jgi:hypothetical protein
VQVSAGLRAGGGRCVGVGVTVPDQLRPGGLDPARLALGHPARHVHDGRDAQDAGGGGDAEPVVAAGRRDDALRWLLRQKGVQRAADLERAAALQVLELQHHGTAVDRGPQDRGAPAVRGQAGGGRGNVGSRREDRHTTRMRRAIVKLKFELLNKH